MSDDDGGVRQRYTGTVEELASMLQPFVTFPNFFKYSEKSGAGAFNSKLLEKHALLFQEMYRAQQNLAFPKVLMQNAFMNITAARVDWNMNEKQRKEHATVLTSRLRTACRQISQGARKSPMPAWVRQVLGGCVVEEGKADEAKMEWVAWGWESGEHEYAWRESSSGKRETVPELHFPPDASDDMFMQAWFGDEVYDITDMTVKDWKLRDASQSRSKKARRGNAGDTYWEHFEKDTGLTLVIRFRPDRDPAGLMSLAYRGGAQMCQVYVADCADKDEAVKLLQAHFFKRVAPPVFAQFFH